MANTLKRKSGAINLVFQTSNLEIRAFSGQADCSNFGTLFHLPYNDFLVPIYQSLIFDAFKKDRLLGLT